MKENQAKRKPPFSLRFFPWLFPRLERFARPLANALFIRLFFTPLNYQRPASERELLSTASRFHFRIHGKRIECFVWGKGTPVLLVHGWAGRGTQLGRFVQPLIDAGYQPITFDGPAHGLSQGTRTDILEYREVLDEINRLKGPFAASIAHSFGSAAVLYAITEGMNLPVIVNIAGPTIGDDIIEAYLSTLHASQKVGQAFRQYIINRTGKNFDEWSSLAFIKRVPPNLNVLLVHDRKDHEVSYEHPLALLKVFPRAELYTTEGLGHYRILKDEVVIRFVVGYLVKKAPPHPELNG